jgi:uncharacterized protein
MTPSDIRFVADGMLQSLGAWLRLLGYDCVTATGRPSRLLLEQAVAENRVFLTRNAHLNDNMPYDLLHRAQIVSLPAEHLPEQLCDVIRRFELDTESFTFTRCVICNLPLERTVTMPADIPADVAARETEFWRCQRCGKSFWRGSHVTNSLARLRRWLGQ